MSETYLANVQAVRENERRLPMFDAWDGDPEDYVGKTIEQWAPGAYRLLPYDECPHCQSFDFCARWSRSEIQQRRNSESERPIFKKCGRCEYREPFSIGD